MLSVQGGCRCFGLCWCRLWLLWGEWCLGFSLCSRVVAPQNYCTELGMKLSGSFCSGEGSVTPMSCFPNREKIDMEMTAFAHPGVPEGFAGVQYPGCNIHCACGTQAPRSLSLLSQAKYFPSSSAPCWLTLSTLPVF